MQDFQSWNSAYKPLSNTSWTYHSFVEACLQTPENLTEDNLWSWKRKMYVGGKKKEKSVGVVSPVLRSHILKKTKTKNKQTKKQQQMIRQEKKH